MGLLCVASLAVLVLSHLPDNQAATFLSHTMSMLEVRAACHRKPGLRVVRCRWYRHSLVELHNVLLCIQNCLDTLLVLRKARQT
jgi:hypothetical protein